MNEIHTTADLMMALAAALENRDLEAVDAAEKQTRDWMTDSSETTARINLIETIRAAIYELINA
jgi:hypothetical protein